MKLKIKLLVLASLLIIFGAVGFFHSVKDSKAMILSALIDEFTVNGTQWVEISNRTGSDIDFSAATWQLVVSEMGPGGGTTTLSGIIPAHGLKVITPVNALNTAGGRLTLYRNGASQNSIAWGTFPGAPAGLTTPPSASESAAMINQTSTQDWVITNPVSRGWYNEGPAPTIASIVADINSSGVVTNMGDLPDPSAATNLYFEKRTTLGDPDTALGKLEFAGPLNLTDASTTGLLQDLGNKMEAAAGSMSFDARMADDLKNAGATVSIYKINDIGYDVADLSLSDLIVKDDDGNIIDPGDVVNYPSLSLLVTSTDNEGTFAFNTDHFTQFGFDSLTVFVDVSNDGAEDGSEAHPYNTIQEGIDAVATGGIVNVASGTYEENIIINKQITLVGDVGDGSTGAGPNAPVILSVASNRNVDILADGVVLKGFVIDNDGYNYPTVRVAVNVASATIQNNEIRNGYSGVTIANGSHESTITKNKIHDNYYGMFINNSENNVITYNEIATSTDNGIEIPGNKYAGGNRFSHNNIHNNGRKGINFGNSLNTTSGNIIVDYNTIDSNGTAGIYIDYNTTGINISHNTISNNGLNEATTGIHVVSATGNSAHNNIISNDNVDTGVWNEDSVAFDATQNFWNDAAGPYDSVSNTAGNTHTGIAGSVTYSPWYGDVNMTALRGIPVVDGDTKTYTLESDYSVTSSGYNLSIPAGTVVTGTTAWDGQINPPSVTTIDNFPTASGYSTSAGVAIEVGFSTGKLLLSQAAKLTFPGEHGKRVGYTRPGESFTEITAVCGDNTQTWADANLGTEGDCKKDSGLDLVVWTKHFTKFGTYTMSYNGGGGGGGTAIPVNIVHTTSLSAACPTLVAGDMVKVTGKPAIYAVNSNLEVLYFPSGDEFKSWRPTYGGYKSINQECFDSLKVPLAYPGAVNYHPGSYVVKRSTSGQLYVVEPNNTLAKITPAAATALYGKDYKVMTITDLFWPHYVNHGADVTTTIAHPGMLVKVDGVTYYVDAGSQLREVSSAGMEANGFQTQFVHTLSNAAVKGLTKGAKIEAAVSTLTDKTQSSW